MPKIIFQPLMISNPSGRLTGVWNGWWADFKSVGTARAEAPSPGHRPG